MSTSLTSRLIKLVSQIDEIKQEEARAKGRYEDILSDRKKMEAQVADLQARLEYGESLMASAPTPTGVPTPNPSTPATDNVRKSIRDLVLLIPRNGEATRAELKAGLGLGKGALNSRLMDAKKGEYIETAGRSWPCLKRSS